MSPVTPGFRVRRSWRLSLLFALALAAAGPAHAQMMFPHDPNQPDLPLAARERAAVIDSIAAHMTQGYVFPEKGAAVAKALTVPTGLLSIRS